MITLVLGMIAFGLSAAIHLIALRVNAVKALNAKLFILVAFQNWIAFIFLSWWLYLPWTITCAVVYVLLIPVYLSFYVTTELVSPSKRILHTVEACPGATRRVLDEALQRENFIVTRLDELVLSGCAQKVNGRYRLTASGWIIARILAVYQVLLGRPMGG